MTDLVPLPVYDEQLVIGWLLGQSAVTDLLGQQVWSILPGPKKLSFPVARVNRVGGVPPSRILFLDTALLQVDVWADHRAAARLIADTLRQYLASGGLVGPHDGGVVTAVEVGGLRWLPDPEFDPAKPRFSFDVSVTLHPLPA